MHAMADIPRDDLEEELWRLRSVEYDLEQSKSNAEALIKRVQELEMVANEKTAQAERDHDLYETARNTLLESQKLVADLQVENKRLKALVKRFTDQERMATTYDFAVVNRVMRNE